MAKRHKPEGRAGGTPQAVHESPAPPDDQVSPRAPSATWSARLAGRETWLAAALLGLGCLWLFGHGIGSYPLWDPWEPKYAQAVREMAERGDFVTPWFDERIRWTKPILIYWAIGVPAALFGNNEWTVRLPSVLAAVAAVLVVFGFVSRLRGLRAGLLAGCVLATLPQFFYMARQAMPDMLLTLFVAAAMGCFALGRFGGERPRLWYGLFYAAVALGFLTKGPLTGAIVVAALGTFWLIDVEPRRWLVPRNVIEDLKAAWSRYEVGRGILIVIAIAAPWYAAMLWKHGFTFIDSFLLDENLERFSEPIRDHHGTAEYYVKEFFHAMYPWSGLLPVGLLFTFMGRRELDEEARQRWYWVSWALGIFVLMTLAGTKMDHYILPITPAVAILAALVLESYLGDDPPPWLRPCLALSVLFVVMPIRDFLVEGDRNIFGVFNNARDIGHPGLPGALKLFLAGWIVAMGLAFLVRRSRLAVLLAVLVTYGQATYLCHEVLPAHTRSRTMKYYLEAFQAEREPDGILVFYGKIRYSTHYYYGKRNYRHFEDEELDALVEHVRGRAHVYFIVEKAEAFQLSNALRRSLGVQLSVLADEHPRYLLATNVPATRGR